MASTAKVAQQPLPDTLPEDFGEWDGGEASPSEFPADTAVLEPAPSPAASRAPARTRESQVASAPPIETPRKASPSQMPVTVHGDNKVFQQRMRPVVVDRSPSPAALRPANARAIEAPSAPAHRTNGAPVERKRNTAPAATAALTEADEVLFNSFRSSSMEVEEKKQPVSNKKWIVGGSIAAGAVVLLLAILIPVLHHSSAGATKQAAEQAPTATEMQMSDPDVKPSNSAATQGVPAKPSAAAPNKPQSPQPANDSTASDDRASNSVPVQSQMMNDQLSAPSRIPQAARASDDAPPPPGFGGMQGLGGNNQMGAVLNGAGQVKVKAGQPKIVTVSSGVAVGLLLQKTAPVYPSIAKAAGVSGTVVLDAIISKTGIIEDLRVVSGPVMLRKAAEDAVRTWRYRPYKLNNEPTEVQTTINVIFSLSS